MMAARSRTSGVMSCSLTASATVTGSVSTNQVVDATSVAANNPTTPTRLMPKRVKLMGNNRGRVLLRRRKPGDGSVFECNNVPRYALPAAGSAFGCSTGVPNPRDASPSSTSEGDPTTTASSSAG